MQTVTGRRFYPLDPRPEDFDIVDIAHALSMVCRFGGHTPVWYSVADHSVRVARVVGGAGGTCSEQFCGLMHDAAEAYVGDVVWPLKIAQEMSGYKDVERNIERAIAEKFGLPHPFPPIVKHADLRLLATEKRDLMLLDQSGGATREAAAARERLGPWHCDVVAPLDASIVPLSQPRAKKLFLQKFEALRP